MLTPLKLCSCEGSGCCLRGGHCCLEQGSWRMGGQRPGGEPRGGQVLSYKVRLLERTISGPQTDQCAERDLGTLSPKWDVNLKSLPSGDCQSHRW